MPDPEIPPLAVYEVNHGRRLQFLDVIRGIAAALVILQHETEFTFPVTHHLYYDIINPGRIGVVIFFLVSGFVIPFSLERSHSVVRFWISRLFRLFPLYWASLAGALVLFHFAGGPAIYEAHPVRYIAASLTMFQQFVGIPNALGVYWTLSLEVCFYAITTALFLLGWHKDALRNAWMSLAALFLVSVCVPLFLHKRIPFAAISLVTASFIGNSLFAWMKKEVSHRSQTFFLSAAWATIAVGSVVCYGIYLKDQGDTMTPLDSILCWTAGGALFLAIFAARERRFPKPLLWLGRVSYSLYLLNPLVAIAFYAMGLSGGLMQIVRILATLALAELTFRVIEEPTIALGKRISKLYSQAATTAATSTAAKSTAATSTAAAD